MRWPFVLSLPHCAGEIPPAVKPLLALSAAEIFDAVDHGTAEIFSELPAAVVVKADYSRLFCDLNRNPECRGEKGVVPYTDYRGRAIFRSGMYPDEKTVRDWIADYHRPYHEMLEKALCDPSVKGLFDCHSLNGTAPGDAPDAGQRRKDVIISNNGNVHGAKAPGKGEPTCPVSLMDLVAQAFEKQGFSVSVNDPYTGGFITVRYGKKLVEKGGFAIQVEMNQDLYLDPETGLCDGEKTAGIAKNVFRVFEDIAPCL